VLFKESLTVIMTNPTTHLDVAVTDAAPRTVRLHMVEALHEDLARVTADVGHNHHGGHGPVAAL